MSIVDDITDIMRLGPKMARDLDPLKVNIKSLSRGAKEGTFEYPCLISDSAPLDMANVYARVNDRINASFLQTWISLHSNFDMSLNSSPIQYLKGFHQNVKFESMNIVEPEEMEHVMERAYLGELQIYSPQNEAYALIFNETAPTAFVKETANTLHLSKFNIAPIMEADIRSNADKPTNPTYKMSDNVKAPQLTNADIKRSNDMVPYGIQVRLIGTNKNGDFVQYFDVVIGVKSILHLIPSDEMVRNIVAAIQNKNPMFKFLRWTTGEISMFKNLVLNIDSIKDDAINRQRGNVWFPTLKKLKKKKFKIKDGTVPYAVLPETTIVVTGVEKDYIMNNFGFDITDPKIAMKLMTSLNLLSFAILDEGTNTVSVIYDGDTTFQMYTMESLEREVSMNSNKLGKEIGRMISH